MATYSQQITPGSNNQFAIASNSVSSLLVYPAVSGNNNNVFIAYNTTGLGTPSVSASSAVNITTTWGDVVRVLVYHNRSTSGVTFVVASKSSRQVNTVAFGFNTSTGAISSGPTVAAASIGSAIYPDFLRKHNLGYF
jgi:hypothetical protein